MLGHLWSVLGVYQGASGMHVADLQLSVIEDSRGHRAASFSRKLLVTYQFKKPKQTVESLRSELRAMTCNAIGVLIDEP